MAAAHLHKLTLYPVPYYLENVKRLRYPELGICVLPLYRAKFKNSNSTPPRPRSSIVSGPFIMLHEFSSTSPSSDPPPPDPEVPLCQTHSLCCMSLFPPHPPQIPPPANKPGVLVVEIISLTFYQSGSAKRLSSGQACKREKVLKSHAISEFPPHFQNELTPLWYIAHSY